MQDWKRAGTGGARIGLVVLFTCGAGAVAISEPILNNSFVTTPAQQEQQRLCSGGAYPAQWTWDPTKTLATPVAATSGKPKVEQYRNGKLIATYSELGNHNDCYQPNAAYNPQASGCGPFGRSPYRQWLPGDTFLVYPAVYSGENNQPWFGPQSDTEQQYNSGVTFKPTNLTIKGVTVNGVRPTISAINGVSNNTLGQGLIYSDQSVGLTLQNLDVNGTGGKFNRALVYLNGANNLQMIDMRVHDGEGDSADGVFGTDANSGTLTLLRVELDHNGGDNGPAHNAYINSSAGDPNFTLVVQNSWSHDAAYGHTMKSRAQVTTLVGNYFQGGLPQKGQAQAEAYLVDIPNAGRLTAIDNIFAKNAAGAGANGISLAYGLEGIVDKRPLSILIQNNSFTSFARTFDGTHANIPMQFFYPPQLPTAKGFPVKNPVITQNLFAGYCTQGVATSDYRGTIALTEALSELQQTFSPTDKYGATQSNVLKQPNYGHVTVGGLTRSQPTVGAEN
jgi:hypothetical protein